MAMMKNTGMLWIGQIPVDWELGKVKYAFNRKKEKSTEKDPIVLSLARAGVKIRDISTNEGQLAASYEGYNPVEPNDLLLNPMDLVSGANCSISKVSGVISPAYVNLRAKIGFEPRYYDYYFKTQYWNMGFFVHGKGVSFENRWTLNDATLKDYYIPMPSLSEQQAIADYLDETCSKIDEIIAEAKASIGEYKELKQSVIFEAVTKGLDKNVEMKDSGIEWIGRIPKHWSLVKSNRFITSTQNGISRRDLEKSTGNIVLKLRNITEIGEIDYSYTNRIELSNKEFENYILQIGDLLFVRVNGSKALVGKCAIFNGNNEPVAYNDHIIRVQINKFCVGEYFKWYLLSQSGKTEIALHINTSAGQYTISGQGLKDIYVSLPPIHEQENIIMFLGNKCKQIDSLISEKESLINDLEAYKKSLIYEVVTGKRRVV